MCKGINHTMTDFSYQKPNNLAVQTISMAFDKLFPIDFQSFIDSVDKNNFRLYFSDIFMIFCMMQSKVVIIDVIINAFVRGTN